MDIAEYLLSRGANPNRGVQGALKGNHKDLVDLMESQKGPIDWSDSLYYACKGNSMDMVNYVLERLSEPQKYIWNNALTMACKNGNMHLIKLLISKGAKEFHVAMFYAYKEKRYNIVKFLRTYTSHEFFIKNLTNDYYYMLDDEIDYKNCEKRYYNYLLCMKYLSCVLNDDIIRVIEDL